MNTVNSRLFSAPVLEFRDEPGTCPRLRVKDQYRTKQAVKKFFYDDLIIPGENNGLFTDRAKKMITELALDHSLDIVFMYSQAIISKGHDQ